jgi:predicted DNA-binding transcriptional regulator YafY
MPRYFVPKVKLAEIFDGPFSLFMGKKGQAPHTCVIEFSAAKKKLVQRRQWRSGTNQRIEEVEGGRVRLTIEVANLMPVVSFVLRWGPHAKALAPAELVAQVAAEAGQQARLYAEDRHPGVITDEERKQDAIE